jgi:hypothetical protein
MQLQRDQANNAIINSSIDPLVQLERERVERQRQGEENALAREQAQYLQQQQIEEAQRAQQASFNEGRALADMKARQEEAKANWEQTIKAGDLEGAKAGMATLLGQTNAYTPEQRTSAVGHIIEDGGDIDMTIASVIPTVNREKMIEELKAIASRTGPRSQMAMDALKKLDSKDLVGSAVSAAKAIGLGILGASDKAFNDPEALKQAKISFIQKYATDEGLKSAMMQRMPASKISAFHKYQSGMGLAMPTFEPRDEEF